MRHATRIFALGVIVIFLLEASCIFSGASAQDATTEIANANGALQKAFENVLQVEKTGANVSSLLDRLNTAALNLTMANEALSEGNYAEAINEAGSCETLADNVAVDAAKMDNPATNWFSRLFPTLVTSLVASGLLVGCLALSWLFFKRNYLRKLSKLTPKAAT